MQLPTARRTAFPSFDNGTYTRLESTPAIHITLPTMDLCYDDFSGTERKIMNLIPIRKVSVVLFIFWLLLVNFLYYAQFKDLIVTHLRW